MLINTISDISLGDRMHDYESKNNHKIKPYEGFVIRFDGHKFSKLTKNCKQPFDINFIIAMGKTMKDLVEHFEAQSGYCHSDEITLIFNKKCEISKYQDFLDGHLTKSDIQIHIYDGRIQKLISLGSAYCSVRFNYHFDEIMTTKENINKYDEKFIDLIRCKQQIFDARVLVFSDENLHEIVNHQIWRSIYDCHRNAISKYAHVQFGHKKILGKKSDEMIEMLKEVGIDWNIIPQYIKYGLYCKKILVEKEIYNEKIIRSEYIFKQLKISFNQENLKFLLDKYYTPNDDDNDTVTNNINLFVV